MLQNVLDVLNGQCDPSELEEIARDYYALIEQVDTHASDAVMEHPALWDYLGVMADYLSIQSNMDDLPMSESLFSLIHRGLSATTVPEKQLDFISHFDIPKEIAEKLVDRVSDNPNHPLYWWVASRCPDHPTVVTQRQFVNALRTGENIPIGNVNHIDPALLMPLGLLFNPGEVTFPRTGIELETNAFVDAVKVPSGTVMGTDSAEDDEILELRLNHSGQPEVLDYGTPWLRRYFEIWRWEHTARAISSSIHIHSEGQEPAKVGYASLLFGPDHNSCRTNNLGTIEVRTALQGYIGPVFSEDIPAQCQEFVGFPELPPPCFIELLHQCGNPEDPLYELSLQRLRYSIYIKRLNPTPPHDLVLQLLDPSAEHTFDEIDHLVDIVGSFSLGQQEQLISLVQDNETGFQLMHTLSRIEYFAPALQKIMMESVIKAVSQTTLSYLGGAFKKLPLAIQEQTMESVLASENWSAVRNFSSAIENFSAQLQERTVRFLMADATIINSVAYLTKILEKLPLELRQETLQFIMADKHTGIEDYTGIVAYLPSTQQEAILEYAKSQQSLKTIDLLAGDIGSFLPPLQNTVAHLIMEQGSATAQQHLIVRLKTLSPELQEEIVHYILDHDRVNDVLFCTISALPVNLQADIVHKIIKDRLSYIKPWLLDGIVETLPPELQEKMYVAAERDLHSKSAPYNIGR